MVLREEKRGTRNMEHTDLPHINGHVKSAGDIVDGADLVTIEDVTDPGVEDVVVLNEGDVLGDDECDG